MGSLSYQKESKTWPAECYTNFWHFPTWRWGCASKRSGYRRNHLWTPKLVGHLQFWICNSLILFILHTSILISNGPFLSHLPFFPICPLPFTFKAKYWIFFWKKVLKYPVCSQSYYLKIWNTTEQANDFEEIFFSLFTLFFLKKIISHWNATKNITVVSKAG